MSDFAEGINERGQEVIEELLFPGEHGGDAGNNLDVARPEISGDMSFASVHHDLLMTFGDSMNASGSELFMDAYNSFDKVNKIDEQQFLGENPGDVDKLTDGKIDCGIALMKIDEYIKKRGRRKMLFFKGAVTTKGKERYNAMCKARVLVEARLQRLNTYMDFYKSKRSKIDDNEAIKNQQFVMKNFELPKYGEAEGVAGKFAMVRNQGNISDSSELQAYSKEVEKVMMMVEDISPVKDFFTKDKFATFNSYMTSIGPDTVLDVAKSIDGGRLNKAQMMKDKARDFLGVSGYENYALLSKILHTLVKIYKGAMDLKDVGSSDAMNELTVACFDLRKYMTAFERTSYLGGR